MDEKLQDVIVTEETDLLSPSDIVKQNSDLDDQALIKVLSEKMDQNSIILSGSRGSDFWLTHLFNLRNNEITREMGEHHVKVPFLSFHVPPGGKGNLVLKSINSEAAKFKFSIVGFGYGAGKNFSVSIDTDFGTRNHCFSLVQNLLISVKEIEFNRQGRKKKVLRSDVKKVIDFALNVHEKCPFCSTPLSNIDEESLETFPAINLSNDRKGIKQTKSLKIKESKNFDIGFDISTLGIKMTSQLNVERNIDSECLVSYFFPGGYTYRAFKSRYPFRDLPYWRKS